MSKAWPPVALPAAAASALPDGSSGANKGNGGGGSSVTRTLLVHIAGNRATWEHLGLHGGLWQVNPERAGAIFADGYVGETPAETAAFTERLSRAMVRSVTLLESNTNIDETVAVSIDGLPPREFTRNGEGASLFLTGEGRITQPQVLFSMSGNTELGLQWMQQYPRYTSENLADEGVIFLTGASYYFVHDGHPVIHFLKANEDQLGVALVQQEPVLEGGWIRVDVDAFLYCVKTLRETVLKNTPSTFNLGNLTVRVAKPDGQRWLQVCPQLIAGLLSDEVRESNDPDLIAEARKIAVQRYFDRPLFVTLRLAVEYALPEAAPAAPQAPAMMLAPSASAAPTTAAGGGGGNNRKN